MPQIQQLPLIYASQLFWLLLVFGTIYFGIAKGMMPKIESTVAERDKRINADLAAAHRARREAEEGETANLARTAESRAAAADVTLAAKHASAREAEGRLAAADAEIGSRVAKAEAELRAQAESALAEIGDVAAEAAREMVAKLAGANVTKAEATKAVKAAMARG